ncbi:MAG: hypothetical protein QHH75_12745 [Bacillota bacterium]|nr:hypothetical protein [Bacillota bacterium]
MTTLKKQLEKALQYELILSHLYQELANKLSHTELGEACKMLANTAQDHISQIRRWLVKTCSG